jgi:hypothetical protein
MFTGLNWLRVEPGFDVSEQGNDYKHFRKYSEFVIESHI